MIRYPNIIGKTDAQKLDQMKSYLHQLVDELNFQLEKNSNNSNDTVQATTKSNSTASTKSDDAISSFNEIKGLIIKSADIVKAYSEEISKKLEGQYVAKSDFGTYKEETQAQITANSKDIDIILEKQESIDEEVMETVRSEFEQQAERISLSVENGEATAQIVLKVGDREIPATIDMKGLVTFSNLLTSDGTTQINGDNIITGKITSADKESMILDLDAGIAELTGKYKTTAEIEERYDGKVYYTAELTGSGLVLRRDGKAVAIFDPFRSGIWSEDTTNRFVVHPQSTNYGDGSMFFGNDHASIEHKIAESFAGTGFAETVYKDDYGGETKIGAGYVSGLNAPTNLGDAVNKQYVDDGLAGKAPAGFGLGSVNPQVISDLNTCKANGWYYTNESTLNVSHTYFKYASVHVSARTSTQIIQRLVSIGYPTKFEMLRYTDDGGATWIEEWVNPPMIAGAEYRTTERYMGKPVYAKLIDCQGMPSGANAAKAVQHNSANVESIVSFGGNMSVGGTKAIALPYYYSDTNLARIAVDYQQVRIFNGGTDLRGYTDAKVWFKYTKTTN